MILTVRNTAMSGMETAMIADRGVMMLTAAPKEQRSRRGAGSQIRADVERKTLAILRVLGNDTGPVGARIIADRLRGVGVDLSERAVRYHLKSMDERGLTRCLGEQGRVITDAGIEELQSALVSDKLGFVISKIDDLAYRVTLDLRTGEGSIILNASLLPAERIEECLTVMRRAFKAGYCMSELVAMAAAGERVGDLRVPDGKVGFGTVCTVTLNGILLKHSIPIESRYGGLLEIRDGRPYRFTELVGYHESTVDPAVIFIASKMTSINEAAVTGQGRVLASFREVPAVCLPDLERVLAQAARHGLGGILAVGKPGQPLLGVHVGMERVGLAVIGGLSPVAALEEAGVATANKAMTGMAELRDLKRVWDL
jgi:repressor of nif and glnA expression